MSIRELIEKANLKIEKSKILYDEPMYKHTTFKIGGPADCFIKIDNINDLREILLFAKRNNIPITVLGNGSNVLVRDKGIRGIVLSIRIEKIEMMNILKNLRKCLSKLDFFLFFLYNYICLEEVFLCHKKVIIIQLHFI